MSNSFKSLAIAILLSVGFYPIALAEETAPAPVAIDKPRGDAYLLKFEDSSVSMANSSGYQKTRILQGMNRTSSKSYAAVLPFCGNNYSFGCIDSVEAKYGSESQWETLAPGEKFWNHPIAATTPNADGTKTETQWSIWEGSEKIGLPPSEKVRVFNSSKYTHGGGTSYVVKSLISGSEVFEGSFSADQFSLSVIPVRVAKYDPTTPGSREIFSVENYLFPKNIEFRITLKLGSLYSQLNGWFFGRVDNSQIFLDSKSQSLTVRGAPSLTPVQTGYMPYPVPEQFKGQFLGTPNSYNGNLPSYVFPPTIYDPLGSWLKYKNYLQERASHESEIWQINAAPKSFFDLDRQFELCAAKSTGVTGLLTTNATVYVPKPPTWNSKDNSLNYQVAGPEFLSDGTKNRGNYLLAIRSDVASCLWKSDLKNARATVEVTNGDGSGQAQVATTTISQRNGWLYFAASGFHFSAPTISVKLTSTKITTLTCVKGKIKKTVSGSNPKCPSGYKKS